MNFKHFILAGTTGVFIYLSGMAHAFSIPESMPLPSTIAQSEIVTVARVVKYTDDPDQEKPKPSGTINGNAVIMGPEALIYNSRLKSPGSYTFQVLHNLKGQTQPELQLHLPAIVSIYYGESKADAEPGSQVLLLLKRDARNQWAPVDSTLPLIPLGKEPIPKNDDANSTVETRVVNLLLASLSDSDVRRANTYVLRSVIHPNIPKVLRLYADDPDFGIRDNVLYCLANHQQVEFIPHIALLEKMGRQTGRGTACVVGLAKFKTPEAVPYLNPLLFQTSKYTRINTMFALTRLADRTSIPSNRFSCGGKTS